MKHVTLFSILFLTKCFNCFGQIEVNITKFPSDSFAISFPVDMNIEIGKTYDFKFNTNIELLDSIKEGFSQQYLYNGLTVSQTFDHYERGFYLSRKTKSVRTNSTFLAWTMFYVNGTNKWKFTLDGQKISRYIPADIHPSSVVDIELQSDISDINKAEYEGQLIMYWMENHEKSEAISFNGNTVHINLADYKDFLKGRSKKEKYNHIIFLLPNVKVDNNNLFKEEQKYRMYIFRFQDN